MDLPNITDIRAAAARILGQARRTPVLRDEVLDAQVGASVWFKCENLQRIGAFKFRGACNAVMALTTVEAAHGVLTHSSGNHGAALGLAARLRGIPAHIVVPENAPAIKIANMRESGAVLHFCAPTESARVATAQAVAQATGALLVHSSSDPWVIAGQGTATLELLEDLPELDVVIAPVGGGGLIAGTAIAAHALSPVLQLYAAEPAAAADAWRAMQSGRREEHPVADTICDGLRTGIGAINFTIMQREQVQVLTASDTEIIAAMRLLWDRLKVVVEPSAAVPLAVLLKNPERFARQRIGVIISGGNVDLARPLWRD